MIIDSSYRWTITVISGRLLSWAVLFPNARIRKVSPRKYPLKRNRLRFRALVSVGLVLARIFGESLFDALLLRAEFGAYVPDTGIHSYGWFPCFRLFDAPIEHRVTCDWGDNERGRKRFRHGFPRPRMSNRPCCLTTRFKPDPPVRGFYLASVGGGGAG